MAKVLGIIGILFLGFAFVDYALAGWFNIDITGTSWSTIIAGAIGGVLLAAAYQMGIEEQKKENES